MIQNFVFSPSAQYYFNRAYSLALGKPGQQPGQFNALQYGTIVQQGVTPSPMRIAFNIEKNLYGASPNHSKIDIYNLTTQSRQSIKQGYLVQLQAGYKNLVGTIFTGNVYITKSDRKGPDIVTSLECFDGGSSITNAILDKSYPPGTTLAQIIGDCISAMGIDIQFQPDGVSQGTVIGLTANVFTKGFTAHGPVKDTLAKVCKSQGLEWSVQNNCLSIKPITSSFFTAAQAIVVSEDTGLIGVPSNNQFYVQFSCLMNYQLVPGAMVQLISENTSLNGFYQIRTSKFDGDTYDQKWQVNCEAVPANNISIPLPGAEGSNVNTAVIA